MSSTIGDGLKPFTMVRMGDRQLEGDLRDQERKCARLARSQFKSWTPIGGATTNQGIWSGLDAATGEVLWQTALTHPAS